MQPGPAFWYSAADAVLFHQRCVGRLCVGELLVFTVIFAATVCDRGVPRNCVAFKSISLHGILQKFFRSGTVGIF